MDTLPSVVSLMRERTVSYCKCHTRGVEKVIWPIVCIVLLVLSILALGVACGTPNWVQLQVYNNATEPRGNITFGLLRGSHAVRYGEAPIISTLRASYFLFNRYSLGHLARIIATFSFSILAMVFSLVNIAVTFLNSYQSVTTWWKGPTMIYLLSLSAGLFAFTGLGLFLDHYLWVIVTDTASVFVTSTNLEEPLTIGNLNLTSFEYLVTDEGYISIPYLQFSIYLEIAGACLPLLVTLLSWRLALLIPPRKLTIEEIQSLTQKNTNTSFAMKSALKSNFMGVGKMMTTDPVLNGQSYTEEKTSSPRDTPPDTPSLFDSGTNIEISPIIPKDVLY